VNSSARGRKRWLRGLLLSLVTLALCLAGLELYFRLRFGPVVADNVTLLPREVFEWRPYPELRYVFKPLVEVVDRFDSDPRGYFDPGPSLTYRINSLGFRGRETTLEKPEGVVRIAGVGDSVLFGSGVRDEHLLTTVLERSLTQAGVPCEVLNFGVPAYDTFEESVFLRRIALEYRPDLAFFLFFLNDTQGGNVAEAFNATGERSFFRRVSALWDHLAARRARRSAIRKLVANYHAAFAADAPGWLRAQEGLRRAKDAADKLDVQLVLVIFPLLHRLDETNPFAAIHAEIARRGRELGYHVLDLLPVFLGRNGPDLWVHPKNQHPNEIGHALAGEAIARFLLEEKLARKHGQ
jgi:hypothetical protein